MTAHESTSRRHNYRTDSGWPPLLDTRARIVLACRANADTSISSDDFGKWKLVISPDTSVNSMAGMDE